ncbi:MAG: hypothetical protein DRR16_23970 [Candidatus Parabeggiatoa sp. nov. 3]|nr:MAG: hypothetical protein DRR00_27005 [Gammaproteobacteria bacterium]RKZ80383.1 MAG: hypothetical protein DRR16_23970 [Gammaproteobacteria bacterium]HEW97661.1 hypothetical protein [Beggiatoa sp.]
MKKFEQVNELHEKAMKMAQAAFVARMQGELEKGAFPKKGLFCFHKFCCLFLVKNSFCGPLLVNVIWAHSQKKGHYQFASARLECKIYFA